MSNTVEINIVGRDQASDEIARVEAALASLKDKTVTVNVKVDKNKFVGAINDGVDSYNKRSVGKTNVQLGVDKKSIEDGLRDAVSDAVNKNTKITVRTEVDSKDARSDLAELKGLLDAISTDDVNIDVDVDVEEAIARVAELKAIIASLDHETIDIDVNVDTSRLSQSINDAVREHNGKPKNIRAQVEVNKTRFGSSINDAVKYYNNDDSPRARITLPVDVDVDRNILEERLNDAIGGAKKLRKIAVEVNKNVFYDSVNEAVDGYNAGKARVGKKTILLEVNTVEVGGDKIRDQHQVIHVTVDEDALNSSIDSVLGKKRTIHVDVEADSIKNLDKIASRIGKSRGLEKTKKDLDDIVDRIDDINNGGSAIGDRDRVINLPDDNDLSRITALDKRARSLRETFSRLGETKDKMPWDIDMSRIDARFKEIFDDPEGGLRIYDNRSQTEDVRAINQTLDIIRKQIRENAPFDPNRLMDKNSMDDIRDAVGRQGIEVIDNRALKDTSFLLDDINSKIKGIDRNVWKDLSDQDKRLLQTYPDLDINGKDTDQKRRMREMEDMWNFLRKFDEQDRRIMVEYGIMPDPNYREGAAEFKEMERNWNRFRKLSKQDRRIMVTYGITPDDDWRGEDADYMDWMTRRFDELRGGIERQVKQFNDDLRDNIQLDDEKLTKHILLDYDFRQTSPTGLSDDAKRFMSDTADLMERTVNVIQKYNVKNDRASYRDQVQKAIQEASKPIKVDQRVLVDIDSTVTGMDDIRRATAALANNELITRKITIRDIYDHDSTQLSRFQKSLRNIGNNFRDMGRAIRGVNADTDGMFSSAVSKSHNFSRAMSNSTRRIPVVGAFFKVFDSLGGAFQAMDNAGKSLQSMGGGFKVLGTGVRALGAVGGIGTAVLSAVAAFQMLSAVGVVGTGAIAAGAVVAQAALAGIVGISSVVAGAIGAAVAAPFVYFAAQSEEVKQAYSNLGTHVKDTMTEVSKPVVPALTRMADALKGAFDQTRPSMERVAQGTADLIDSLGGKLPGIAKALGPAMEKAFSTGAKHMNTIADAMPGIVDSFGNLMERMGSGEVMKATRSFWQGLPKWIDRAGGALEGAAEAFNNINEFMSGDQTKGFREGMSGFFREMGATDWTGMNSALGNAMNTFGSFMGSIDGAQLASIGTSLADGFASMTKAAEDGRLVTAIEGIAGAFEMLGKATEGVGKGIDWFANLINAGDIKGRKEEIEALGNALDDFNMNNQKAWDKNPGLRNASQALRDTFDDALQFPKDLSSKLTGAVINIDTNFDAVGIENAQRMLDNTRLTIEAMLEIDSAGVRDSLASLNEQITGIAGRISPENLPQILDAQNLTIKAAMEIDSTAAMSQIDGLMKTIALEPSLDPGVFDAAMGAYTATVNATMQVDDAALQTQLSRNYTAAVDLIPQLGNTGQSGGLMNAIQVSAEIIPKLNAIDPAAAAGLAASINKSMGDIQFNLNSGNFAGVDQALNGLISNINAQIQLHPEWNIPPIPLIQPTLTPTVTMPPLAGLFPNQVQLNAQPVLTGMPQIPATPLQLIGQLNQVPNLPPTPMTLMLGQIPQVPPMNGTVNVAPPQVPAPANPQLGTLPAPTVGQPVVPGPILPQISPLPAPPVPPPVVPGPILPQISPLAAPTVPPPVVPGPILPQISPLAAPPVAQPVIPAPSLPVLGQIPAPPIAAPAVPTVTIPVGIGAIPQIMVPQPPNAVVNVVLGATPPPFTMPPSSSVHNVGMGATPPPFDMPDSSSTHTIRVVTVGGGGSGGAGGFTGFGSIAGIADGAVNGLQRTAGASSSFNFDIQSIRSSILRVAHEVERGLRDQYEQLATTASEAFGGGMVDGLRRQAPAVHQGMDSIAKAASDGGKKVSYEVEKITHDNFASSMVTWKSTIVRETNEAANAMEQGGNQIAGASNGVSNAIEKGGSNIKGASDKAAKAVDEGTKAFEGPLNKFEKKIEGFEKSDFGAGMGTWKTTQKFSEEYKKLREAVSQGSLEIDGAAVDMDKAAKVLGMSHEELGAALQAGQLKVSLSTGGGGVQQRANQTAAEAKGAGDTVQKAGEDGARAVEDGHKAMEDALGDFGSGMPVPQVNVQPAVTGMEAFAQLGAQLNAQIAGLNIQGSVQAGVGVTIPTGFAPLPPLPIPPAVPPVVVPTNVIPPIVPMIPPPPPIVQDVVTNVQNAISGLTQIPRRIQTQAITQTNAPQAASEINSLNNKNTSSTHTVHVRVDGDTGAPGGNRRGFAGFGSLAGITGVPGAAAFGGGTAGLTTSFNLTSTLESTQLVISNAVKDAIWNSWREVGAGIGQAFDDGLNTYNFVDAAKQFMDKLFGRNNPVSTPANTISIYKDGVLVSQVLAEGIRDGDKYIVKATGDLAGKVEDAIFTMPKAVNSTKAGGVFSNLLDDIVSIGTGGIKFKFNFGDWSSLFQQQAMRMSAGYLNEFGQFIVYNVTDSRTVNNNFDGGLIGDPERQAKRVLDVLNESQSAGSKLRMILGNGVAGTN